MGIDARRRARLALLAGALLGPALPLRAAGTDGAAFLGIPVGGRPAALGGAYSALARDAYAPVWNPAGLGSLPSVQVAGMHLLYLQSIGYEFVGAAVPLGRRDGVGASAQFLHPESSTERDASGAETGRFSSYYGAYTLSYGRAFTEALSGGVSAKLIDARLGDQSGRALGADVGGLYRVSPRVSVAAVAANLGGKLRFIDERQSLPDTYRLGLLLSPASSWDLALETVYGETLDGRLGLEWRPMPALAMRAGYRGDGGADIPGVSGLTLGVGLTFFGQRFDYAWAPMGDLGQVQYFSVLISFGKAARS